MTSTAPLDRYIRRALDNPEANIFSPSDYMPPPTLVQNEVNCILTFRGCFNPPHRGHKDTLCHGFFRGGKGIRLIAAIILPVDDKAVAAKYRRGNSDPKQPILTIQERINIINDSGLHGGWHWCHPRGVTGSEAFKRRLVSAAAEDGFVIKFIILTGADHIGHEDDDAYHPGPTVVVGTGDHERTRFRMETETGLRSLSRYNDWRLEALEEAFIQELGASGSLAWLEQKLLMLFPLGMADLPSGRKYNAFVCITIADLFLDDERLQTIKDRLRTHIWRLGQTRFCRHSTGPPNQWVRFVPTSFFGMTGGAWFVGHQEEPISSTRLRHVITNSIHVDELEKALPGIALSPQLLIQYIKLHRRRAALKCKRRSKGINKVGGNLLELARREVT
jgi:hypothetical protein